ncbi:MAG: FxDxF family PEP-CTERM protein [Chakrabartia sp.]
MKSQSLRLALASVALIAMTPAAHAAQSLDLAAPAADGSISGTFQNLGIAAGAFTDTFTFNLPSAGDLNATISSIFRAALNNNVDFTSVTINGQEFTVGSTGAVEFRYLNGMNVPAGQQTLTVNGTSGGNGSYAGTLAFAPLLGGVPEPAAWTTLLAGFALVGSSMRRNRPSRLQKVSA